MKKTKIESRMRTININGVAITLTLLFVTIGMCVALPAALYLPVDWYQFPRAALTADGLLAILFGGLALALLAASIGYLTILNGRTKLLLELQMEKEEQRNEPSEQ